MSCVICPASHVTCHMSNVMFFSFLFYSVQCGGGPTLYSHHSSQGNVFMNVWTKAHNLYLEKAISVVDSLKLYHSG